MVLEIQFRELSVTVKGSAAKLSLLPRSLKPTKQVVGNGKWPAS